MRLSVSWAPEAPRSAAAPNWAALTPPTGVGMALAGVGAGASAGPWEPGPRAPPLGKLTKQVWRSCWLPIGPSTKASGPPAPRRGRPRGRARDGWSRLIRASWKLARWRTWAGTSWSVAVVAPSRSRKASRGPRASSLLRWPGLEDKGVTSKPSVPREATTAAAAKGAAVGQRGRARAWRAARQATPLRPASTSLVVSIPGPSGARLGGAIRLPGALMIGASALMA